MRGVSDVSRVLRGRFELPVRHETSRGGMKGNKREDEGWRVRVTAVELVHT